MTFGKTRDYKGTIGDATGVLIGETEDNLIYLYEIKNGSYYDYYILSDKTINFNEDSSYMFNGRNYLENITFENIDTLNVTDMSYIFYV